MIIEQNKINEKLNNLSLGTMPHSLLLIGDKGCGKHSLVKEISTKLGLNVVDITEDLSVDKINDIYISSEINIYTIECDKLDEKKQNVILKFLEEPLTTSFIILICNNELLLIDTILNRCQKWYFESYSKEYLQKFTDNELVLELATTPGQVMSLEKYSFNGLKEFCEGIFTKIKLAYNGNVFRIPAKVESDYDIDIFLKMMIFVSRNLYVSNLIPYDAVKLTDELINNCNTKGCLKTRLLEKFLFDLKYLMKEWEFI